MKIDTTQLEVVRHVPCYLACTVTVNSAIQSFISHFISFHFHNHITRFQITFVLSDILDFQSYNYCHEISIMFGL